MPKKQVSTSRRPTSRSSETSRITPELTHWLNKSINKNLFLGLALGGGKTNKTAMASVEYYPEQKKIFLKELHQKIIGDESISADTNLFTLIERQKNNVEVLALNVPLTFPKCIRCKLKCPGYESCEEKEIKWMWKNYEKNRKEKRPQKIFTPYTERCIEHYISNELEEAFHPPHAFGSNHAPLTARAHFLTRRLDLSTVEVNPKVSLWRIGRSLGIRKSYLRFHKHAFAGEEARYWIIDQLLERDIAFIYEQDRRLLIESSEAFEAFLCALTGVLAFKGECEKRPKDFPRTEGWIEIPKQTIQW